MLRKIKKARAKKLKLRKIVHRPRRPTSSKSKFIKTSRAIARRSVTAAKTHKVRNKDIILVLDFGSQYTQLIARRVRESKVFSRIVPYTISAEEIQEINPKGLILSGGPMSVYDRGAPALKKEIYNLGIPILGVCYGMQLICDQLGGKVQGSKEREFGRAELFIDSNKDLFANLPTNITCWMSHSDQIARLPPGFTTIAHTLNAPVAAIANRAKKMYGVQFHPEVAHTQRGVQVLSNFIFGTCGCLPRWTMDKFIDTTIKQIKETVGKKKIILGLSGGVDSSVAALLLHIESFSPTGGPSAVIKSHHNVGGLPKNLKLGLIEPFRELFKDEVRAIGKHLGIPDLVLKRQPFPGPGLAIRIIGEVTRERLEILREADERVLEEIKKAGLYNEVWQSFAVLLPIKTVGVMGDQRTYENVLAIRCVSSLDGMTADWVKLPYELLGQIANRIINEVRGVNRVVYDISSKPPATIEWE
ncbi:MAG: glutamine-hydrolyzing GMP synthase [Candidatus Omnitrophica bacterium]|nr:glutamine-hydrolyzing GMP synthase [Candidatus Omnitrophota bacterium]